jgi:hypothetical protein
MQLIINFVFGEHHKDSINIIFPSCSKLQKQINVVYDHHITLCHLISKNMSDNRKP